MSGETVRSITGGAASLAPVCSRLLVPPICYDNPSRSWGCVASVENCSPWCGCFCLTCTDRKHPSNPPSWAGWWVWTLDQEAGCQALLHGLWGSTFFCMMSVRERDSPSWNQGTRAGPEDMSMTEAVYHRLHTLGRNCLMWASTQTPKAALLLPLFYQWRSWGSESCGRLPKVTPTGRNRAVGFDPDRALSAPSRSPRWAGTWHVTQHPWSSVAAHHGAAVTFSTGLCLLGEPAPSCHGSKLTPSSGVEWHSLSAALLLLFLSLFPFDRCILMLSSEWRWKGKEPTKKFFFLFSNCKHTYCRKMFKYWQRKKSPVWIRLYFEVLLPGFSIHVQLYLY